MLATEFTYFIDHRAELLIQYLDKHIVIEDGQVLASFDTEAEGYAYVVDNGLLGTALLQLCSTDEASYVQYVRQRNRTGQPETSVGATNGESMSTITVSDTVPSYSQGERVQAKLKQTEDNLAQLSQQSRDELLALRKHTDG